MTSKNYVAAIFSILLFVFTALPAKAGELLDSLKKVEPRYRAKVFETIYEEKLWHLDSADAIQELDAMLHSTLTEGNLAMEINILTVKGFYYRYHQFTDAALNAAVEYYKKALEKAKQYGDKLMIARINHYIGNAFLEKEDYPLAFEYLLKADEIMKETGYAKVPAYHRYSFRLGTAYYNFGNYERAQYFFEKTIQYAGNDLKVKAAAHNLMGNIDFSQREYRKALGWYGKALKMAEEAHDSEYIGVICSNIGNQYMELNELDSARPMILRGYELGAKTGDYRSAAQSLLKLAYTEGKAGNIERAGEIMKSFDDFRKKYAFTYDLGQKEDYQKIMSKLYEAEGNYKLAKAHQDSLLIIRDSLLLKKDANMLANLEVQLAAERHLSEMALMEEQKSKQKIILTTSWILSGMAILLLAGIIYGLYMRQKRQQKEKQMLLMENERSVEKVENYRERLKFFIEGIREKNRLIEELKEKGREFDLLQGGSYSEAHTDKKSLEERLHESVILTEEDWSDFKLLFEKAHPGFIQGLQARYPQLTTAEVRLLTLIKLNFSVSDMANMLGISPESVSTSRLRLWKKLGLKGYRDIPVLLAKF